MRVLYDTSTVHQLDRYEYTRAGAATELAPVEIRGRAPGDLHAEMSVGRIGDFAVEVVAWAADTELAAHRTGRLIRACDPECYRLFLSVNGGPRMEQAGSQVSFGARDLALYDLSRPWQTTHTIGRERMRVIMLNFPRALVPITHGTVAPLVGTAMPRRLSGRDLVAQLLIAVADDPGLAEDPGLADVLRECVVGLVRQRLGRPSGITPETRRMLQLACVRGILARQFGNPALGPAQIAKAAHISPRYLHKLFQGTEFTPMKLLKRLRLEECHRRLSDPALDSVPLKEIIAGCGYLRHDQFARDFKQLFGVSATQVRQG